MQGSAPLFIARVNGRTSREQKLNAVEMFGKDCEMQRRPTIDVASINIGLAIDKYLERRALASKCGHMDWRRALVVSGIHVGAVVKKEFDKRKVGVMNGIKKCSGTVFARLIYIHTTRKKSSYQFDVPGPGRFTKGAGRMRLGIGCNRLLVSRRRRFVRSRGEEA